jgi:FkbM family methyltransferase
MHRFVYPNQSPIFVTSETVAKTHHTFDPVAGIWEPESIHYFYSLVSKKHHDSNAVIVDVGAQSGLYTLYARFLPHCRFYAFEPFVDTYALLLDNLQVNGIENVKAYPYALGSKQETKLLHVPEHLGLNTFGDTPKRFTEWKDVAVDVKRLDDILSDETSFDYMKCDTEGWELHVLKGAEESIRKWKPELFLEVNPHNLQQCSLKKEDLYEYLHSLGYKEKIIMNTENVHFSFDSLNNL